MRRAAKVDTTHHEIREAMQAAGIAVKSLAPMGNGYPDFLVCVRKYTALVEAKSPGGKLTKAQVEFMANWPGDVWVAESGPEAVEKVLAGARHQFVKAGE